MTNLDPTAIRTELAAMRRLADILGALDPDTRRRVFGWLVNRYAPVADDAEEGSQL